MRIMRKAIKEKHMKKKLIISVLLCMLAILAFSLFVSAEDATCEHEYDKWNVVIGEKGFLGETTASATCKTCGQSTTEIIPKIFITKGYSNSNDGIMQDYGVNRESLARYEELTGEAVKFGAVVALKDSIGGKNPLNGKGEPISSKVKSFDYTETEYSVISVAIKGIPDNVKSSSGLLCALYVSVGGRTTYIDNCAEKETCGTKTFEEIEAVPEKDETKLEKVEIIDGQRYHQMTIEEMGLVARKYWNNKASFTADDTSKKFFGTKSLTPEDLPNGTIIYIKGDEWQYRPHKWYQAGNSTRPSTTKTEYTVVDDSWWYDSSKNVPYDHVGFNISYYKSNSIMETVGNLPYIFESYSAAQIAEIFKIYVPITYVDENVGDNEGGTTDPNPDQGGTEGGETPPPSGGENEGGNTGSDVVVPELPDYSAEKQNWQDDGALKILAIGNSFSDDAMDYVYQVAKDAGVENVKLGKLYIGGCSLATHLSNAKGDKSAYDYKTNTSGKWDAQGNKSIKFAVESDDWDFITFQQVSGQSGIASTYDDLYELIKIVEPLNPSARLAWHMTWAYQKGAGHSDFSKYDKDQMTMYNAIVDAVNAKILTIDNIEIVIPSGTAIQNTRTSFIGDTLTRDGYHLSYGIGRYIASMTFVKALTGLSIDNSKTTPDDVDSAELTAIIECVNNAMAKPYAITESSYKERPVAPTPDVPDTPVVDGEITIPEGYRQLTLEEMGWQVASYWQQKAFSHNPNDDFHQKYYGTVNSFTKEDIPIGSIIILKQGENWQYRPDAWNGSRPGNVTAERVVVDEAWWSNYTTRGFNLSKINGAKINTLTPEEIYKVLVILVPVTEPDVPVDPTPDPEPDVPVDPTPDPEPDVPVDPTPDPDPNPDQGETTDPNDPLAGLVLVEYLDWVSGSYWNSNDASGKHNIRITDANNSPNFWSTRMFTKEQLPVGSVIVVESGWKYRPDGWVDVNSRNSSRPGEVKTSMVVIDDAWWGKLTVRAFNISTSGGSNITSKTEADLNAAFKIYVPKSAVEANKKPEKAESILNENGLVKSEACVSEIVTIDGKQYRALTAEAMGLTLNSYYWSSNAVNAHYTVEPENAKKYFSTKVFEKNELVDGTLIWIESGWQYRPEGWVGTATNTSSTRPGNVTSSQVVDEAWWGNFDTRAFNVSTTDTAVLADKGYDTVEEVYAVFKIYVPVELIAD